jgi:Domain of unknown function DUF11/Divergent InlB B-repeat domain
VPYLGWPARHVLGVSALLALLVAWHGIALADQLILKWTDTSTNELGFSIERSTGTAGSYSELGISAAGATSYTDPTVATGVSYCYRVRAFNAIGYSAYSNVSCATPGSTAGLAVIKAGSGDGTVTSAPTGINCGATCSASYPSGSAVTITATPDPGSTFSGWSGGGCGGTGICTVTLSASTVVTATFDPAVALIVTKAGTGNGNVTSQPAGIACGGTCSASYPRDTHVTLTATPAAGSAFAGWNGGGCSGAGACVVALTTATTVNAAFQWVGQGADLSVSVPKFPGKPHAKKQLQYTVKVTDLGPAVAVGSLLTVNVSGLLPGDLASIRAPNGCTVSGSTISCPLGDLKAGTSVQMQISMVSGIAGTIVLTADTASGTPDPVSANNSVTIQTVIK